MAHPKRFTLKPPKEDAVHRAIANLLNVMAGSPDKPKFMWWHTPNGEHRSKMAAVKVKAMGGLRGVWDIVLLAPGARLFFIEVKRPTATGRRRKPIENKLSPEQFDFLDRAGALGVPANQFAVVDDATQVRAVLRRWDLI